MPLFVMAILAHAPCGFSSIGGIPRLPHSQPRYARDYFADVPYRTGNEPPVHFPLAYGRLLAYNRQEDENIAPLPGPSHLGQLEPKRHESGSGLLTSDQHFLPVEVKR
jgi:hypothetical protein